MSSPNQSTCLIDLSGSNESPTSNQSLISFPPISADEMIVPLKRFSISNDPFDTIEKQANLYGDPFEIINISSRQEMVNAVSIPTATLLDFDGSRNSSHLSIDSPNNSRDPLNKAMCTNSSITTNPSLVDVDSSDTMNHAFLQSASNSTNRSRILSDPVTSKLSKTKRKIGKTRCASLEQICLKNQLRKSITNSPIGSPNWSKTNNPAESLESSLIQKKSNSNDFNLTSESLFDDLLSTNPEWIESDNDDSDYERMTIPFLKNIQDNESTIASTDCSSDRSSTIEKLSKFRKTDAVDVVESANTSVDKQDRPVDGSSLDSDNITSIIETLRNAVKNCGDEKKKDEASALLDNLNVCFNAASLNTSTAIDQPEPQKFIRQRTFSMENQLNDSTTSSSKEVSQELSNSMPLSSTQTRKSISGISQITPRRFSRSLSYAGKPVSVVSAVQQQSNSSERRSSVCTTPTRLVRQASASNPKSTRTSLGRQSLLSSLPDEKAVVKPVQRKTIMKTSNPLPSSNTTRPLKLRVGEQTKPSGPLKAVIPYQRSLSLQTSSEPSTKAKRTVKTSTPLASNNISKSGIPAASSTPVLNMGMGKPPLTHFRHSQSRLSYTPATPIAKPLIRQPSSERKKRSVTFSEETDKFSQSMIVGGRNSIFPPVSWCKTEYIFCFIDDVVIFRFLHCKGVDCHKVMAPIRRTQFFRRNSIVAHEAFIELRIKRPFLVIYFIFFLYLVFFFLIDLTVFS